MNDNFSRAEYEIFINSLFLKKGWIHFKDGLPALRANKIAFYDANAYPIDELTLNIDILDRDIINGSSYPVENRVYTSLYYDLMLSTLSKDIKRKIVSQWVSTFKVINQIKTNSHYCFLIVGLGGTYIEKHKHERPVKQTLTFQFTFPEFMDPLSKANSINLYNQNTVKIQTLVPGKTNKTVFTIKDNITHDAQMKDLTFFWIYDYYDYIDISNIDFGDFEFVEFQSVQS